MSRVKGRATGDFCADCGAADPSWASINRGILLCAECCSVHRRMGRHISHVKSLHQGTWPPTLLTMVNVLTVQNVNSIWEHSLLDPNASKHLRRKPQPKDQLSMKSDFILAKHQRLSYVFRPRKDDLPCTPKELSRQLHSSVRSANLDTSLRLLVQGADPNYFNHEKGTACLHVACRTGNSSQAELLVAWGADPNIKDVSGNTPSASARLGSHVELADRMLELVYEVTDRLAYHLCSKKPNHKNGQHYITLEKKESHEMTDLAKTARGKLQLLPNHLFEELVMDIYDEVDRRECEAVWMTSAVGLEKFGIAFLPVNPALSPPRNQGRQKLARLSSSEMAALLRDILMDANRRQHIATLKPNSIASSLYKGNSKFNYLKPVPAISDDEPLYDSVASDDDYAALMPAMSNDIHENSSPKAGEKISKNDLSLPAGRFSPASPQHLISNNANDQKSSTSDLITAKEIDLLREQLSLKDCAISELKSKVELLQTTIENLTTENVMLKKSVEKSNSFTNINSSNTEDPKAVQNTNSSKDTLEKLISIENHNKDLFDIKSLGKSNQRPTSMYETRERPKFNWHLTKHQFTSTDNNDQALCENPCSTIMLNNLVSTMPQAIEVHNHLEVVTKGIQELWGVMQDPIGQGYSFSTKANKIRQAVDHFISIFPKKCDEKVLSAICQLSSSCKNLERVCSMWNIETKVMESDTMDGIRSAAYELAKAAKALVSNFPLEPDN